MEREKGGTGGVRVADGIDFPDTGDGRLWVVGAVVAAPDGRVFAQRRSPDRKVFPGCWDLVGGHVEPGESVRSALAREIAEETGWRLASIDAELHRLSWTPDGGTERHEVDYLVRVRGDLTAPALEPGKHTAFRWLSPADLPAIHNPDDPFVTDLLQRAFAALEGEQAAPPASPAEW
ncbi:NUDIX hydrolase [Nocardiopsis coralliicola]